MMLRTLKLEILSLCLCVTCLVCWAAILIFAIVLTHGILNENMSTTSALLSASYAGGVAVLLAGSGAYALVVVTIMYWKFCIKQRISVTTTEVVC